MCWLAGRRCRRPCGWQFLSGRGEDKNRVRPARGPHRGPSPAFWDSAPEGRLRTPLYRGEIPKGIPQKTPHTPQDPRQGLKGKRAKGLTNP